MNEFFSPFYAAKTAPKHLPQTKAENRLRQVLDDGAAHIVSEAVKRWRDILRQAVRDTAALKFTDEGGKAVVGVPIEVIGV